ncbi:MAG: hypothetical protein KIH69_006730 [Anaerolineae bacterium]|nr:hypothetical protein [Anaerolineae bacterium]
MAFVNRLIHLWVALLLGLAPFLCIAYCHAKHTFEVHYAVAHMQHQIEHHEEANAPTEAQAHFPLQDLTRMMTTLIETLPPLFMLIIGLCLLALIWPSHLTYASFCPTVISPPPRLLGVYD